MRFDIVQYPDPILRKKAKDVEAVDKEVLKLLDDMAETMYDAPGIGLAAPQIGKPLKVIVADISSRGEKGELIKLINPCIVHAEGEDVLTEGCLSIPGFSEEVKRATKVVVRGINEEGKEVEIVAEGLLARVFQHEIDHIEGRLFIDRLSKLKRELLKRKIIKNK